MGDQLGHGTARVSKIAADVRIFAVVPFSSFEESKTGNWVPDRLYLLAQSL
jgi:hypothetical protein